MINIVKLILICQVKDRWIPQLIPLFWIVSRFFLLAITLVIVLLYRYSYFTVKSLFVVSRKSSYFWCW